MQFLVFLLVYPLIWIFSILPLRILYIFSDGIYYLLYYIIGYRKKTVYNNLKLVFPKKSELEIQKIAKKFYRHFIDIFIEMIKSFTISEKEISKRYRFKNIEVLQQLELQKRSGILLGAHYGNWEWIFILNVKIKYNGYAIYKKIKNIYLDKKIRSTRGRFNTNLIPTKETFSLLEHNTKENILSLYGFLGDQSPKADKAHYWSEFLGIHVPIYTGAEMLAKKHNLAVSIFLTKKIKRGYYETTLELITDQPTTFEDYEITDIFLEKVEQQIMMAPEFYFWTHKRFKHKKPLTL